MKARGKSWESLAGRLLLAHPVMKDPNFGRSVILMSAHDADGALGLVINRPLGRTLGELGVELALGPLAKVPLYRGGPVEPEKLILAAWRCPPGQDEFEVHFGLEPEKAERFALDPHATLRGFLGYAGWSKGQLENELGHSTWFIANPAGFNLASEDGPALWRLVLGSLDPELKLLADEPEDPSRN